MMHPQTDISKYDLDMDSNMNNLEDGLF